jgi:hypothetical protein
VHAKIEACSGADWAESLEKLRRHFDWEYENYKG